ncbi:MAG: 4Fe-4S dicluster domain-containing protein, partial [Candidatus Adiutrix sp.]|nr:4Fe-4S dicluster domain-containing protein [Candidatus Adiutrix sp.]
DTGSGLLQPSLSFERGYCRVNCVECSLVCPTGAIRAVTIPEKSAIQVGRGVLDWERCIVQTDKVECTACSRNCPTGAITLVGAGGELKRPVVDREQCLGCGACEYYCPARPLAAIKVQGNWQHRRI